MPSTDLLFRPDMREGTIGPGELNFSARHAPFLMYSGTQTLASTYSSVPTCGKVPSALEGLTAVFGMGTGVTPPK